MTKKEFLELIDAHADKFKCLSLFDATERTGFDKFCIAICWKTTIHKTPVLYGRGRYDSLKAKEALKKYENYLEIHKS